MGYADEQSYEEVISALTKFKKTVVEECGVMYRAGEDCVDNMDNDPAALGSCNRLADCIKGVQMNLELVDAVIEAMRQQIERIRIKAEKANQY